jgi:hypothetical protein
LGITFSPTAAGQRVAVLSMPNNDPAQPNFSFIIRGEGLAAADEPTPDPDADPEHDCNANGVEDADDIATGASDDCNIDGVPDECETDTDGDGVTDDCDNCPDIANSDQSDTNGNGFGDACDGADEDDDPCAGDVEPVCGSDGLTYANACAAELAGIDVAYAGPCTQDDEPVAPGEDIDEEDFDDEDLDDENFDDEDFDDDDFDDEDLDDENLEDEDFDDENAGREDDLDLHTGMCGAGSLAMIPLAMAGMCSMRLRRRTIAG